MAAKLQTDAKLKLKSKSFVADVKRRGTIFLTMGEKQFAKSASH